MEEMERAFKTGAQEQYVILGNGIAGLSAAEELRKHREEASIVLISDEPYDTYNRPMLTKKLLANPSASQTAVKKASWYEEKRIIRILGKRVSSFDVRRQTVTLEDQTRLPYEKLIYALGAECAIPPIGGLEDGILPEGVVAIRRLGDIVKIHRRLWELGTGGRVAVIGGGILGLEAAWELRKMGHLVTVLEMAPRLMERQIAESESQLIKRAAEREGVRVLTGVQAEAVDKKITEGRESACAVRLSKGEVIPADLIIISAGIRPNTALAERAGILVEKGIAVNSRMETSCPGVYACGDCAQYQGKNMGLWREAMTQGKTAGANAAGALTDYREPNLEANFRLASMTFFNVGELVKSWSAVVG